MLRRKRYRKIILIAFHLVDAPRWSFPLIVPSPTARVFDVNLGKRVPRKIHLLPLVEQQRHS